MCAEVSADDENVVRLCNAFNYALKWSGKAEIKEAVLKKFIDNVNGNGDDYMCARIVIFLLISYHMHILFQ